MDDKEIAETLERLGLTANQARIYLYLLARKEASAAEVSKATGINRSVSYRTLEELLQRGYASYLTKGALRYYVGVGPQRLLNEIIDKEQQVKQILPELLMREHSGGEKTIVQVFEGREAFKNVYEDIIENGGEWLDLGLTGTAPVIMPNLFIQKIHKARIQREIELRALVSQTKQGVSRARELQLMPFTRIRFLPKGFISNQATHVYGNKVALAIYSKIPVCVLVESKSIADFYRKNFEWIWRISASKPA